MNDKIKRLAKRYPIFDALVKCDAVAVRASLTHLGDVNEIKVMKCHMKAVLHRKYVEGKDMNKIIWSLTPENVMVFGP